MIDAEIPTLTDIDGALKVDQFAGSCRKWITQMCGGLMLASCHRLHYLHIRFQVYHSWMNGNRSGAIAGRYQLTMLPVNHG